MKKIINQSIAFMISSFIIMPLNYFLFFDTWEQAFSLSFSISIAYFIGNILYEYFTIKNVKKLFKRLWFLVRFKRVKEVKEKSCYGCVFSDAPCKYEGYKCWKSNTIVKKRSFNLFKWIKSLLTIILLAFTLSVSSQNFDFKLKPITPVVDLSILTATTAYWVYADNVQPDKVIHFLFGYFSTQAMNYLLAPLDLPKGLKIGVPIIVFGGLAMFKELADSQADWNDFKAGMLGCGIASVSFTISYTIKYR